MENCDNESQLSTFKMNSSEDDDINFIKNELLPELVYERCFCDVGSREFVEYDSACVKSLNNEKGPTNNESYYSANIIVKFSGEPKTFSIFIKLLPATVNDIAYDWFLNEEIFYNSHLLRKSNTKCVPKCYAVSMGKYGRPTLVLEDLNAQGFEKIRKLNLEELNLCASAIGFFHESILKYVREKNCSLNNFSTLKNMESNQIFCKGYSRIKTLIDSKILKKIKNIVGEDIRENLQSTVVKEQKILCHGHFSRENLLFKYENGKAVDVKAIRWHTIKYNSIGMDLAFLILENLSNEMGDIDGILTRYLKALKSGDLENERNSLSLTEVRSAFVSNLLHAYFTLSLDEDCSDEKIVALSEQLERLGAFNEIQ
ncbi:uncharacterized protein LOC127286001 isoform X5 [Leptopilina boulardi]|uniref:uncharacterized protein LOC127286001 isoform X5 n=1 Tax=Leptopilina boulardi TaxID=63433 RepID=UPI0021F59A8C|nr:uncharacterized protein LOC127286001 isoform X5 [Leptopilina boulardi]